MWIIFWYLVLVGDSLPHFPLHLSCQQLLNNVELFSPHDLVNAKIMNLASPWFWPRKHHRVKLSLVQTHPHRLRSTASVSQSPFFCHRQQKKGLWQFAAFLTLELALLAQCTGSLTGNSTSAADGLLANSEFQLLHRLNIAVSGEHFCLKADMALLSSLCIFVKKRKNTCPNKVKINKHTKWIKYYFPNPEVIFSDCMFYQTNIPIFQNFQKV